MQIDFSALESALMQLEKGLINAPKNDLERDGVIQRFEYTFESAWKSAKKVLESVGISSQSPKSVIRDLAQQGWIESAEEWLSFLVARNESTYTYRKQTAEQVFELAQAFPSACRYLLKNLRKNAE